MAKQKPAVTLTNYGIYSQWDEYARTLPKLIEVTTDVPLREHIEFGFIVNIKRAKNEKVHYCIAHPDIPGKDGEPMAPFIGEEFIKNNDWDFYLGDTLWLPLDDKAGHWHMSLSMNGQTIAEKTFLIEHEFRGERTLGQGRTHFKPRKRW